MLNFYFDDSYTSGEVLEHTGGVFVLAGWAAPPVEWDAFEPGWQERVIGQAPRPITRLHMADLENPREGNRGEFRDWTRDEQNRLMRSAVDAILDDGLSESMFGLAVAIDIGRGRRYPLADLFSTALYQLLRDLVEFVPQSPVGIQLAFEDDNRQFWPLLQGAIETIREWLSVHPNKALETLFANRGYLPSPNTRAGLQAADLLAYEIKRRVELRPKQRKSYERIVDGRWHVFRRTIADVDGPLPLLGLPTHTFDPPSRNFLLGDGDDSA